MNEEMQKPCNYCWVRGGWGDDFVVSPPSLNTVWFGVERSKKKFATVVGDVRRNIQTQKVVSFPRPPFLPRCPSPTIPLPLYLYIGPLSQARKKKARTAWMIFSAAKRAELKGSQRDSSLSAVSALWKGCSTEDKVQWQERAAVEKEQYNPAMAAYKPPADLDSPDDDSSGGKASPKRYSISYNVNCITPERAALAYDRIVGEKCKERNFDCIAEGEKAVAVATLDNQSHTRGGRMRGGRSANRVVSMGEVVVNRAQRECRQGVLRKSLMGGRGY
jgi:hypothetical protein